MFMLKQSPLIEEQRKIGAKFIAFKGWKLPLEFSNGATKEHLNVRKNVGLFDVSHMGEIRVKGVDALAFLEKCLTNNMAHLQKNRAQYNLLCNKQGGVIDDLIAYCIEPKQDYLLCVNAGQIEVDYSWLNTCKPKDLTLTIENESSKWAQLALQGPKAPALLEKVLKTKLQLKKNYFQWCCFAETKLLVANTGYTGEAGFEILLTPKKAPALYKEILMQGQEFNCMPAGLAARDTLRMEMQYPLYGQELSENIDPLSAGLAWALKNPKNFIGSKALLEKKNQREKKRIGFKLLHKAGVPRTGNRILQNGQPIGEVTSGALSPCLGQIIGMGYVSFAKKDRDFTPPLDTIEVEIHQHPQPAQIVAKAFIKQ